ncbi:MAG: hypothetical protein ABI670_15230 [Chloroflexota bacterium]
MIAVAEQTDNTVKSEQQQLSQLFLIRLWAEEGSKDEHGTGDNTQPSKWHGKAQHVVTGEAHTFTDWTELVNVLQAMLPGQSGRDSVDKTGSQSHPPVMSV